MQRGWKVFKGEALLEQCKNTGACEKTNVKVHTHVYCNEHLVSKYLLTRHGNSHLLPLCFCVAKYLKNVLVFLSHRRSYTQELYHATKVNTNKIWYGNTCGKDFQIKWRLHSYWLIHVASSFQNGSHLWSCQFVKVWKGVTFVAAVRSL